MKPGEQQREPQTQDEGDENRDPAYPWQRCAVQVAVRGREGNPSPRIREVPDEQSKEKRQEQRE